MGISNEFRFDPAQTLQPAFPSALNRMTPVAFGASLTIPRGQAMGQKTSDAKHYPLDLSVTNGVQLFKGFNQTACATDASGNVFLVTGANASNNATASFYGPGTTYGNLYTGGIFDPADLLTAAGGTPVAEVDTITPTSPTSADVVTLYVPGGDSVSATLTASTAANYVTVLKAAIASNPAFTALVSSGTPTATLVLTAKTLGVPLNITVGQVGTGTSALVVTTPATDQARAEVDTITPTGSPTTGDVYTVTINYPNGTTHAVSATVGATQTATGAVTALKAAWNADPVALAYATPTGTATFILTSTVSGSAMNLTAAVVGTGTVSSVVVTTATAGRNLADILPGCPGARVLSSGFWELP